MNRSVAVLRTIFVLAVVVVSGVLALATQPRPRVAVRANSVAVPVNSVSGGTRTQDGLALGKKATPVAAPQSVSTPSVPAPAPVRPATAEASGTSAREPSAPPPVILPRKTVKPTRKNAGFNFALASNGAAASGGSNAALLIDGDWTHYDGGNGFASTQWRARPPDPLMVTLKQTVEIDAIRFLLWDREENRYYRYKLEVSDSADGGDWNIVADRTGKGSRCKSWQLIEFKPRSVRRIRLTGTYNSVNSGFHVVELEAYDGLPRQQGKGVENLDF